MVESRAIFAVVIICVDPVCQARLLIIEEDTTILDSWWALDFDGVQSVDISVLWSRSVGPKPPW
jgi:hypothetical protein